MARIMISLSSALKAIESVIEYYRRDIDARLAREGAECAMHALEAIPAFIAEDFACASIIDMTRVPEDAQSREVTHCMQTMLEAVGTAAADHGMIKTGVLVDSAERPAQKRITIRFTMMRPMGGGADNANT